MLWHKFGKPNYVFKIIGKILQNRAPFLVPLLYQVACVCLFCILDVLLNIVMLNKMNVANFVYYCHLVV